jgi:hypothetical protein
VHFDAGKISRIPGKGYARIVATGKSKLVDETIELFGLTQKGRQFPVELSLSSWMSAEDIFYTGIIRDYSEAEFSHSMCPECSRKLYPEYHRTLLKKIENTDEHQSWAPSCSLFRFSHH